MWPNLIPRDILKAEDIPVVDLKAGMIAVFSKTDEFHIVHRILSVRHFTDEIIVESGGDRSGPDEEKWHFASTDRVKIVTGVLRLGHYRDIRSVSIPVVLSPPLVVRLYCGIVRRLFW